MTDFDELCQLAQKTREYIRDAGNRVSALRAVLYSHDIVLGIFPANEGFGLHVIKGDNVLRELALHGTDIDYSHTAIALNNREQAVALQHEVGA